MKAEYLIFNLFIIAGPLFLSFEKGVHYFARWKAAFASIFLVLIPFIVWDALVTNVHWWFNEKYTLDYRFLNLPVEEWLFFISVPFAVLFTWEILQVKRSSRLRPAQGRIRYIFYTAPLPGLILFINGLEYTGLMLIMLASAAYLDAVLKTRILFNRNLYLYLILLVLLILVFNGYLTARPVVLYNESYMLGTRIGTVPVEDFGYGIALILLNTVLFEYFKRRWV